MKINVYANVKNLLIKVYVIKNWNPSDCKCECDKSCDIGQYLDYSNCKCRKKLVDKPIEECTKNVNEEKITEITQAKDECSSCTLYIVLFSVFLQ